MRIEFGTTGFCPAFQGAAIAQESEALGYDVQLFGENHTTSADLFGEMRAAAEATSHIRLHCGPVNFVTRDPGVVASAIAPIQIASNGRAICGVARGDSAVAMAGLAPQGQADLSRDLDILRRYLHRETVTFGDRESRLDWIGDLPYQPVPIDMVCSGPRAIALAATKADRIGLSVGSSPERVHWAMGIIDEALAEAGRTRDEVSVGVFLPLAITEHRTEAASALRPRVAGWAHMSSFPGINLESQPDIMRDVTEKLRQDYDYRYHKAGVPLENKNTRMISEEFADWFGLGGPPNYLSEKLIELAELGISSFCMALVGQERERFAAEVMPTVRSAASR